MDTSGGAGVRRGAHDEPGCEGWDTLFFRSTILVSRLGEVGVIPYSCCFRVCTLPRSILSVAPRIDGFAGKSVCVAYPHSVSSVTAQEKYDTRYDS
jgi:hypothetical protein